MSKCAACPREYRVGTMALVFSEKEAPARRRVCPECARRGLLVVAKFQTKVVKKEVRSDAVDRAIRELTTFGKMAEASGLTERAEAFEASVEALKRAAGIG